MADRNEEKSAYEDIAIREFAIVEREINLKYHYGEGNVTASTRNFIKPPIAEMGEGMMFKPELSSGYQAKLGAKPPRQLQLFLLLEQLLIDEDIVIEDIRDIENQIAEFLLLRAHEMAFSKLEVSLFNREQNVEFRRGMLEQEEKQRIGKEKEVLEETDYLAPYLARLGNPSNLTYKQAIDIKYACLDEFKEMLLIRANTLQNKFEQMSESVQNKQNWYTMYHDSLCPEEETKYFEEVNNMIFYLKTLEIRLTRHRDLSNLRYEAMLQYLNHHPMLETED